MSIADNECITLRGQPSFMSLHLTLGCTARCRHCVFECSPDKVRLKMTQEEVIMAVQTARDNGVLFLGLSGGEPFLELDLMEVALKEAAKVGLPYSYVVTNGFWATSPARAYDILASLADLGLRRIQVSYDRYHSEFVPVSRVINVCQQAEALRFDRIQILATEFNAMARERILKALEPVRHYALDAYIGPCNFEPAVRVGRGVGLTDTELTLPRARAVYCQTESHLPLITVFPGHIVSFCGYANPRLTYEYTLKRDWLASMLKVWNGDRCVIDMWNYPLSEVLSLPEPVQEIACGYCFKLLPELYPDKELIDIRALASVGNYARVSH